MIHCEEITLFLRSFCHNDVCIFTSSPLSMTIAFPTHPKCIAALLLRVSFGLSLLFVGLVHYMTFTAFSGMVSENLGVLSILGTIWAYILPGLMIVGGALFVIGLFPEIAAWTAGIALASIPAGMLLQSVLTAVPLAMNEAVNAFIWLLVFFFVAKSSACCGSGKDECCSSK